MARDVGAVTIISRARASAVRAGRFRSERATARFYVAVVQPDGKILIGGDFTTLSPMAEAVARNHIARLNPDGTLDTAFNPNANGNVFAIAVQADGKILVGGVFDKHRRTDAQPHRPARCHDRLG